MSTVSYELRSDIPLLCRARRWKDERQQRHAVRLHVSSPEPSADPREVFHVHTGLVSVGHPSTSLALEKVCERCDEDALHLHRQLDLRDSLIADEDEVDGDRDAVGESLSCRVADGHCEDLKYKHEQDDREERSAVYDILSGAILKRPSDTTRQWKARRASLEQAMSISSVLRRRP